MCVCLCCLFLHRAHTQSYMGPGWATTMTARSIFFLIFCFFFSIQFASYTAALNRTASTATKCPLVSMLTFIYSLYAIFVQNQKNKKKKNQPEIRSNNRRCSIAQFCVYFFVFFLFCSVIAITRPPTYHANIQAAQIARCNLA